MSKICVDGKKLLFVDRDSGVREDPKKVEYYVEEYQELSNDCNERLIYELGDDDWEYVLFTPLNLETTKQRVKDEEFIPDFKNVQYGNWDEPIHLNASRTEHASLVRKMT